MHTQAINTPGYSGTPLAKKLGIVAHTHVHVIAAPEDYRNWLAPLPEGVVFEKKLSEKTQVIHCFTEKKAVLSKTLNDLRHKINSNAAVWVSWPKKASKVPTDMTEDVIREVALPLGYVDVKVCAVSEVWSGLKLVIRKALR